MNASPVLINGQPGHTIEITDRGFQYGDGLFETILLHQNRLVFFDRHMNRLQQGCSRLGIPYPGTELLYNEAMGVAQSTTEGVVKILLTRGSGGRGYNVPIEPKPNRVISWHPLPANVAAVCNGITLQLCQTALSIQPLLAGIKHCNRLEQILASRELRDPSIGEGLMLDTEGFVVEGIRTNLFFRKSNTLYTPQLDRCGVEGIAKAWILEQAANAGVETCEKRIRLEALFQAEEIFVTNSIYGVMPVVQFHGGVATVGWPVGAMTLSFQEAWEACLLSGAE